MSMINKITESTQKAILMKRIGVASHVFGDTTPREQERDNGQPIADFCKAHFVESMECVKKNISYTHPFPKKSNYL
jgi:hypothetical protein